MEPAASLLYQTKKEQVAFQIAHRFIAELETQTDIVQCSADLKKPNVQKRIVEAVEEEFTSMQKSLPETDEKIDVKKIVVRATDAVIEGSIDIPTILVVPTGKHRFDFKPFKIDFAAMNYPVVTEELWIQHLSERKQEILTVGRGQIEEDRLEDIVITELVGLDDLSYDDHGTVLHDLASQTVKHFGKKNSSEDARKILRYFQTPIAKEIRRQMELHKVEKPTEYKTVVSQGFSMLKDCAYSGVRSESEVDFHQSVSDKLRIRQLIFSGFKRCLYARQKFDSDTERRFAEILDRDSLKWFRPVSGQFQMFYELDSESFEYRPDFVAETKNAVWMLEVKASTRLNDAEVQAKRDVALRWCTLARDHAKTCGGKPWFYALIPHDAIVANMTLDGVLQRFG